MNITENIKYIGVDDTTLDLFENQYAVPEGVTYNSYLIEDDKIAIMDTVDRRKSEEWMARLTEALEGRTPIYLVVQHMEPDHGGSIAAVMERWPEVQIVASAKAVQMLPQFFEGIDFTHRTITVKEGDTLSLGHHTLQFVMAPMVHWPEVMVTYEQTERVLFSADGFGTFGALYGNLTDCRAWPGEARRYYYNICGKYGQPVQQLLRKAEKLDIAMICPLHGPMLTEDLGHYIGLYDKWSRYEAESDGILIAYASIHGGTAAAALHMARLLREKGASEVTTIDLCRADMSAALAEAFRMKRLLLAASSYDGGLFTPMYEFLHRIAIKGYKNHQVGIIENGSWAPCAGRIMKEAVEAMKDVELIEPIVTIRSAMKPTDLPAMEALAEAMMS
ncbi:MAG: FprA family A-type flavoprotein [Bacteroidaceae bacterium]|nr:FprA family A-type flavoprotein [Bacteroidaceae bacterium]